MKESEFLQSTVESERRLAETKQQSYKRSAEKT